MITRMKIEAVEACVELIRGSFRTVADEFGFTEANAPGFTAFSMTEERLCQQYIEEQRPMFIYMNKQGRIIGFYSLQKQTDDACELSNLCVAPEFRHLKVGKQLFGHAVEQAKQLGYQTMNIGIVEENQVLRKWYQNMGAVHIGTKKFDFFPFTCGYMKYDLQ